MKYFRNTELAKIYKVSEKTVRNWVQATRDGKLELQLFEENGKWLVANTSKNAAIISELAQKGKKYKNSRGFKTITPKPLFYETYNPKQIFDIISTLAIHHELPLKYGYLNGGADYWNTYAERLAQDTVPNVMRSTIDLMDANLDSLFRLVLSGNRKVNVIDLGPGNGLPVKSLLVGLLEKKLLNRYIAIDISDRMLDIVKQNVADWFGGQVPFEGYVRDLDYEQFDDLFAEEYAGDDADIPINLVLLIGGTLCNFRLVDRALQAVNNSIGADDWFAYSMKLDTPNTRRQFDFSVASEPQEISPRHKLVADLLGIDSSLYEVEPTFDEAEGKRSISIVLKVDLAIRFAMANGTRVVELHKNEPILLWRSWQWGALDVINRFDRNDFDIMHTSRSKDQEYLYLISKIKTGQQ